LLSNGDGSDAPYGFSMTHLDCAVVALSFPHEIGHNLGAHHDRWVAWDNPLFPYGFGYVDPQLRWRTILAYSNHCSALGQPCPRIARFSNPDQLHEGTPLGVAEGSPAAADNRRAMSNGAAIVANYRAAVRPANDSLVHATQLTTRGMLTETTTGASAEHGEPAHAARDATASVWHRWTAPASGWVAFSTAGSGFDTVLAVYTGARVDALTPVAASDDAGGRHSSVRFPAEAGATYLVALDGAAGATGAARLRWTFAPAEGVADPAG
jgi:hypothetical protein